MRYLHLSAILLAGFVVGCGDTAGPTNGPKTSKNDSSDAGPAPTASIEGKKLLLDSEPAGAKGVIDLRKYAKDGDEVVVAAQVGGSTKPFTESRASFLIVDQSLKTTDGCDTPWDFCELPKKEVAAARVSVKFVDAEGKTLKSGARAVRPQGTHPGRRQGQGAARRQGQRRRRGQRHLREAGPEVNRPGPVATRGG